MSGSLKSGAGQKQKQQQKSEWQSGKQQSDQSKQSAINSASQKEEALGQDYRLEESDKADKSDAITGSTDLIDSQSKTRDRDLKSAANAMARYKVSEAGTQKDLSLESREATSGKPSNHKANARTASLPQRGKNNRPPIYGALDLGTNNCRLLLARPTKGGFQIVDAFSRIIRLGQGLSETGQLSNEAMERTIDALKICAAKMDFHKVSRARLVATEACRAASNAAEFLDKVKRRTGINLEIIDQETEAKLAVSGCATLIDKSCDYALIFDIGGGSSELIWLDLNKIRSRDGYNFIEGDDAIIDWISIPIGVVTMAERFDGRDTSEAGYRAMIDHFKTRMQPFVDHIEQNTKIKNSSLHFLGTSGTVTTVAGVHLRLEVYDRQKIDGLWMSAEDVPRISRELMELPFEKRAAIPSIGRERADLVLGGCAILEAMLETWSPSQLRVADRGLREGILAKLMVEDGHLDPGKRWISLPKKQRPRSPRRARRS